MQSRKYKEVGITLSQNNLDLSVHCCVTQGRATRLGRKKCVGFSRPKILDMHGSFFFGTSACMPRSWTHGRILFLELQLENVHLFNLNLPPEPMREAALGLGCACGAQIDGLARRQLARDGRGDWWGAAGMRHRSSRCAAVKGMLICSAASLE